MGKAFEEVNERDFDEIQFNFLKALFPSLIPSQTVYEVSCSAIYLKEQNITLEQQLGPCIEQAHKASQERYALLLTIDTTMAGGHMVAVVVDATKKTITLLEGRSENLDSPEANKLPFDPAIREYFESRFKDYKVVDSSVGQQKRHVDKFCQLLALINADAVMSGKPIPTREEIKTLIPAYIERLDAYTATIPSKESINHRNLKYFPKDAQDVYWGEMAALRRQKGVIHRYFTAKILEQFAESYSLTEDGKNALEGELSFFLSNYTRSLDPDMAAIQQLFKLTEEPSLPQGPKMVQAVVSGFLKHGIIAATENVPHISHVKRLHAELEKPAATVTPNEAVHGKIIEGLNASLRTNVNRSPSREQGMV